MTENFSDGVDTFDVCIILAISGPGCSKLTMSLVNVSLKFQTLISEICHYFLLKKCEKLLHCKSFPHFPVFKLITSLRK